LAKLNMNMKSLSFRAIRSFLTLAALGLRSSESWWHPPFSITHPESSKRALPEAENLKGPKQENIKVRSFAAGVLFALLGATLCLKAASGDLDPSFAKTGMTRLGFGLGQDYARAVAVQADGKLIVAGTSGPYGYVDNRSVWGHFSLVRFDTNNVPDYSFGVAGTVTTQLTPPDVDRAHAEVRAVKVQTDGKIVAAGYAYTRSNHYDFAVVRYHADGSLDSSFGTNGSGVVFTDFGDGSQIHDMAIQADGRIVVVGHLLYDTEGGAKAVALARYLTNGVLDGSFGNEGKQLTFPLNGIAGANAMVLQPDGKILAVGFGTGPGHKGIDFALYRYTTNGFLDGTFGGGSGKVFTAITTNAFSYNYSDSANAVTIQPGNFTPQNPDKILVVGTYRNVYGNQNTIAVARYGMDGVLDSTFGSGGIATNALPAGQATGNAVMIQGSGILSRKILVGGGIITGGANRSVLVRYTMSGVLDSTFQATGYVITSAGARADETYAMASQAGKIVAAGTSWINNNDTDFVVTRFTSDGSPDNSFDNDGVLTIGVGNKYAAAKGIAVQSDGKSVVAGYAENGEKQVMALMRLNADGLPDTSFGAFGKVTTALGTVSTRANAVLIQPDGKIVAAGAVDNDLAVARYLNNGILDNTFGSNGVARLSIGVGGAEANAIAIQDDGKIVVAGSAYNGVNSDFAVARFTTNGAPDTSFDTDGKVMTTIGSKDELASAVKIQADGKIVVAGSSVIGTGVDIALVRYLTNGVLDNSFGLLGRVVTDIGAGSYDLGQSLAIQPDGRILVAGVSALGPISFAVARYQTNGVPDNSFDGDGRVTIPIAFAQDDRGFAMALQSDGKIIVAGTSYVGAPQFSAIRLLGNGMLDESYGTGGKVIVQFSNIGENIGYAVALDSLGRAVIAGDAGGLFGVARLQGDPMLKILSIVKGTNGQVVLEGRGVPGVSHTVQVSATPGSFAPLGTVIPDALGLWRYEDNSMTNAPLCFYRLFKP
jgi:uncharacterized delta-60 repeat protein